MRSKTMLTLVATALLAGCTDDSHPAGDSVADSDTPYQSTPENAEEPAGGNATANLRTEVHVFNIRWDVGGGTPVTSAIVHLPLGSSYGGNFTPPADASLEAVATWTCTVDPCDMHLDLWRGHNFTTGVGGASPLTLTHDRLTEETWKVRLLTQVVSHDVEAIITATLSWKE